MKAKILDYENKEIVPKARYDRWVNAVNKFGGSNDPVTRSYFTRDFAVSRTELTSLYEGDWIARKAVEIMAKDATREFITFVHDDPKIVDLFEKEFERLDIRGKVEEAIILQRLYGGNAMVIGAFDGQTVDQPLGKVRQVDFFNNVDRFLAYPMTFYQDQDAVNYGEVETYQVQHLTVVGSKIVKVHESRVIRFDGNYLPPTLRVRNFGWGAPVLHNLYESMRQFGIASQSGSATLQDFVTKKLKIANLAELLSNDIGEEQLINRLQVMAQELAINNIAVYGADEEFDKMGTPVTGLADLIDRYMDIVSAAIEIPKSRFFSNMTGKLGGDSGAADLRTHYDNVAAFQKNRLAKSVRKIIDIIGEPHGLKPGSVGFDWVPLWQLSELDEAKVRNEIADSDTKYINAGVVEPEEVALSRFAGDSINVTNMTIDVDRRENYVKQLSKQPVPGAEDVEPVEPDDDLEADLDDGNQN